MIEISDGRQEDIPAIIDIAEKTWWSTYAEILAKEQIEYMLRAIYAPDSLRKQIDNKDQTYLLLRDEQGPQGFASFGPRKEDPKTFKVHKIYVLPGNQKKGYGRALIEEITRRLRAQGTGMVDLNVNRFNPARTFYEKLGFHVIREEDVPIGPYWMNDYVMRLEF